MGGIDRITGDAWYLTFAKGKNKKLKRGEMFELVCKGAQRRRHRLAGGHRQAPGVAAVDTWAIGPAHRRQHRQAAGVAA
jgi:hypothetical protein